MITSVTTRILLSALLLGAWTDVGAALMIRAEQAHIKTIGGMQNGAWNLWSDGEWADFIHFPTAGTCTIRVSCYGSPALGVWPEMAFTIDGAIVRTVTVASAATNEYAFEWVAGSADYRIGVSFLNDARSQTEDRNLFIVSLSAESSRDGPDPSLTAEPVWHAQWAEKQSEREAATLARAAAAIEKNRKADATLRVVDEDGRPVAGAGIVVKLVRHDFLFGANIYMFDRFGTPLESEHYKERFRDIFNFATTGFYWRDYEPKRGEPDYAYTDKVVAWCMRNDIRIKGHPLLWGCESGSPRWLDEPPPAALQKQRVVDIMTRYAGKIDFWEVVNEPAHLPALEIDDPYRWARSVNPDACLIVNDYAVMDNGCPPFFALLQQALARGVPFDGIGIQAHEPRAMRFPLDRVWEHLDRYANLGRALHITEFTPTSGGQKITGSHVKGRWDEAAQADYAVKFYTVCFAHPAVAGITWWDLCDVGAWLPGGGLLRKDLSPKPAYLALEQLIRGQWMTKAEGTTDADGTFAFRGFCGNYVAGITQDGKGIEQTFHLGKQEQKVIMIDLRKGPLNLPDASEVR